MSSSDVAKSQRVLDKIGARLGITPAGKQWLIAAVDPWHDTPLEVTGYPDVNEAASVVQVVKLSTTISAPTGLPTGNNWDAHFHQFPWMRVNDLYAGNWSQTIDGSQATGYGDFLLGLSTTVPTPASAGTGQFGGFVVDTVAAGGKTFQYNDTGVSIVPFDTQLQPYLIGEYRIIAMGFEVINTTSELNIQGLCTVYRQPCAALDSCKSVLVTGGSAVSGSTTTFTSGYPSVLQTQTPPSTTAQALLLEGSKQWKAKEGCYVVSTMNSPECTPGTNTVTPILELSSDDHAITNGAYWGWTIPRLAGALPAFTTLSWTISGATYNISTLETGSAQMQNFNHSGAIFSGLSYSTTLQVNAIYYIERFPSQQDSALVVLARQSAREDCVARDLYSEIIREMPVGVPQRMNGLGEWFNDAVSSAVDFVSPVLSAIPHPLAQGAAMAAKTVKNISNAALGKAAGATYAPSGNNTVPKKTVMPMAKKKKKVPLKKK